MRSTSARHIPYTTFRKTRSVRRCKKTFSCFFAGVSWRESVGRWSNGIRKEAYSLSPSPPAAAANEWQVSSVRALPKPTFFVWGTIRTCTHPSAIGRTPKLTHIHLAKKGKKWNEVSFPTYFRFMFLPSRPCTSTAWARAMTTRERRDARRLEKRVELIKR